MNYRKCFLIIIAQFMAFSCGARAEGKTSILFGEKKWNIRLDSMGFSEREAVSGYCVSNGFILARIDSMTKKSRVNIYSAEDGSFYKTIKLTNRNISNDCMIITKDSTKLFTIEYTGIISVYDVNTNEKIKDFTESSDIRQIVMAPNEKYIAALEYDYNMSTDKVNTALFKIDIGTLTMEKKDPALNLPEGWMTSGEPWVGAVKSRINNIIFTPDGSQLLVSVEEKWSYMAPDLVRYEYYIGGLYAVDTNFCYAGYYDYNWNSAGMFFQYVFSPDNSKLITYKGNGYYKVFDLSTKALLQSCQTQSGSVTDSTITGTNMCNYKLFSQPEFNKILRIAVSTTIYDVNTCTNKYILGNSDADYGDLFQYHNDFIYQRYDSINYFARFAPSQVLNVDDYQLDSLKIFVTNRTIQIINESQVEQATEISIYDINGRTVLSLDLNNESFIQIPESVLTGAYYIILTTNKNKYLKKIIL